MTGRNEIGGQASSIIRSDYWHEFRYICFFYKCMQKYYNIMLMIISISSMVVLGMPTTLIYDLIVFVLSYFVKYYYIFFMPADIKGSV